MMLNFNIHHSFAKTNCQVKPISNYITFFGRTRKRPSVIRAYDAHIQADCLSENRKMPHNRPKIVTRYPTWLVKIAPDVRIVKMKIVYAVAKITPRSKTAMLRSKDETIVI